MKKISKSKTSEIIKKMKQAKIGDAARLDEITRSLERNSLQESDSKYISMLTRVYKDANVTRTNNKNYHTRLSAEDRKPPCNTCGRDSLFYCNMNDVYFCEVHVIGHDENEF